MTNGSRYRPLVSVITATYNCAHLLAATRAAIDAQGYENLEWIVVDGGSTDGSVEVARTSARLRHVVSERDAGIYDAWNKGVTAAKGEWICFLGGGDRFLPDAVAQYVEHIGARLRDCEPLEFVSSRVRLVSDGRGVRTIGRPWAWRTFRDYMCAAHCGAFHNRSLFDCGSRYDITYRIVGDYEFLLRKGPRLRTSFLDAVTVEMLAGGTSDAGWRALREAERAKVSTSALRPIVATAQRVVGTAKWLVRRIAWY